MSQNLQSRLEAAEARALKSEYCLLKLRQYLYDYADVEDSPDTNEVRPNDYMRVIVAMDTFLIDLPAAREIMRKAERCDEIEACAKELHEVLKEAYKDQDSDPLRVYCLTLASGLASSWLAGKIENGYIVGLNHETAGPITVEFRKEAAQNVQLRDALEAANKGIEQIHDDWAIENGIALKWNPFTPNGRWWYSKGCDNWKGRWASAEEALRAAKEAENGK
jgi:hypothetical protein